MARPVAALPPEMVPDHPYLPGRCLDGRMKPANPGSNLHKPADKLTQFRVALYDSQAPEDAINILNRIKDIALTTSCEKMAVHAGQVYLNYTIGRPATAVEVTKQTLSVHVNAPTTDDMREKIRKLLPQDAIDSLTVGNTVGVIPAAPLETPT